MENKESLHRAFNKYAVAESQQAYEKFLYEFFKYAKEKGVVHMQVEIDKKGSMNYGMVNTSGGYFYVVCTDEGELLKGPEGSSSVVPLDKVLVRMLKDDQVKGICVNPYSAAPCFIPKEYAAPLLVDSCNVQ